MRTTTKRMTSVTMGLACLLAVGLTAAVETPVASTNAPETELGKLAASMKPGEVKELKTQNCNQRLFRAWYDWEENDIKKYGSQKMFTIICYCNEMKWDPVSQQVFAFGGGHHASHKFITYSVVSNAWQLMPVPLWMDPRQPASNDFKSAVWPAGHSDDSMALWPEKRLYGGTVWSKMRLYNIDKAEWLPPVPGFKSNSRGPCEAFPELGGFVALTGPTDLCVYNPETGTKRALGKVAFAIHGVMEYNPVHKVMLIAGGGADANKMTPYASLLDATGKIKSLKPLPDGIRFWCLPDSKLLCDPLSGEYVVCAKNGRAYAFHPLRDEWRELPVRLPGGLGVAVGEHGVMMFVSGSHKAPWQCWLYKHKPVFVDEAVATKEDPKPPAAP